MTGEAAPEGPPWEGVDELTYEIVTTAASLLGSLRAGYADAAAALRLRVFATTMCGAVAHLTEVEQVAITLTDPTGYGDDEQRQKARDKGRLAWRSAVFALNKATALAGGTELTGRVGMMLELEPAVTRLLGLREALVASLARLEPLVAREPVLGAFASKP